MTKTKLTRYAAAPVLVLGLGLSTTVGCGSESPLGCEEFNASADWGASIDVDYRVRAFMGAAGSFSELGATMVADVSTACEGIATATKQDASAWESKEGNDRVTAACNAAKAGIDAVLKANASAELVVLVEGGRCEASLDASAECNARCDVTGKCTPAQLEAKCEPGQLAGECTAECRGACTADVGATVQCQGTCSARCDGDCAGTCSTMEGGKCAGRCDGTCNGTCSGTCELEANANVQCSGTCRGECSVEFQAPHCEGKLTPPECQVDADCQASCNAEVQAEASCTPPKITATFTGSSNADLEALATALQTHLPALVLTAYDRGQAAVESAQVLVDVGSNLEGAATSSAKAISCTAAAASAALQASAQVNVSVQASVSVSGSATGSTM
ncbi:hypothetical protein [Polyangium aurulentum]|uniref:hypothetical protein n=1 Tax=Polyangium aurulentum TaxID=2567896 RepID=UPI0010ADD55E|nr:hypothetical protein [Polyangium aurulentum]UQA62292.1 hypothetical protein E8A73_018215 [Polyangium aurulentum]